MVCGVCPFCQAEYRLQIAQPLEVWYATQLPELVVGDRVAGPCLSCFTQVLRGEILLDDYQLLESVRQKLLEEIATGEG